MKLLPIGRFSSKPVFSGYTVEDSTPYGYPRTHLDAALRTNKRYEKTLGTFHDDAKNKIYYADPLESIDDGLREKVDYIFYDDEPAFPDINNEVSKAYFNEPKPYSTWKIDTYKKSIDDYKQYFYRMEMADSKFVGLYTDKLYNNVDVNDSKEKIDYYNARIADSKYNQETAAGCIGFLEEASGKIDYKNNVGIKVASLSYEIKQRSEELPKAEKELEQRMQLENILSKRLNNLEKRKKAYLEQLQLVKEAQAETLSGINATQEALNYNKEYLPKFGSFFSYTDFLALPLAEEGYKNANLRLKIDSGKEEKEQTFINAQLEDIKKSIEKYTVQKAENKVFLKKITDYKEQLPKIIADLKTELNQKSEEYKKLQAELIPYFDKLKNYFYSRGLRQVKY